MEKWETFIKIPKFSFWYNLDINTVLLKMGIKHSFDEFVADFSEISEKNDIFIKNML